MIDGESQTLQAAMEPRMSQVSYSFNGKDLPTRTRDYSRNSLIFATKLVTADEFRNLNFTFSQADGEGKIVTRRFAREQFHKVEGASGVEIIQKMAAMAEIRKAYETKEKCKLSVTY